MKITFAFPKFNLVWDKETGQTTTYWKDGTESPTWCHWEDEYHGNLLGITAQEHRLQHELAHHLVGMHAPDGKDIGGCLIVWREAHGEEHPEEWSKEREWLITALQYRSCGTNANTSQLVEWGVQENSLAHRLNSLLHYAQIADEDGVIHVR